MKTIDKTNELRKLIVKTARSDRYVRNAVLAVSTGDGNFNWSGAEGFADPEENREMTVDTPVFIASITKIFTAATVMLLFEKGSLKLNTPISEYLPSSLIKGIHVYNGKDYTNRVFVRHLLNHTSGIPDYYTDSPKDGPGFRHPTPIPISSRKLIWEPLDMKRTYLYTRSKAADPDIKKPAHLFSKKIDMTFLKGFHSSWADGGIISTMEDCLRYIKAFHTGKLFRNEKTLSLMREWVKLARGMYYGFGTMRFVLPEIFFLLSGYPNLIGHSGSTGSFHPKIHEGTKKRSSEGKS